MTARELALFEALAGDLLSELGYERACPEMSLSQRLQAHSLWLRVQAQRGAARACKLTSRQQRRLRAVRNGLR